MALVTLAPGVHRIPTMGDFINSFVFAEDDGSVTLVDCGVKRAPRRIVAALAAMGRHPQDVQRIVLTHAHADHAGGAAELVAGTAVAGVSAHADDVASLESGTAPVQATSPIMKTYLRMVGGHFAPVPVEQVLHDGDVLPMAGGVRVLHTPGHTPGHVSLLHETTGVLITGDAIWNMRSRIGWPVAAFCTSAPLNARSAAIFADLDYRIAAFTHGPEIRDNAREQVRDFLRRKRPEAAS